MRIRVFVPTLACLAAAAATGACTRGEEGPRAESATAAAPTPAPGPSTVTQSGGALAARQEAQASFDSARAGFVRRDTAATLRALRTAAEFTRGEAEGATGAAKAALVEAAGELDSLAARVRRGAAGTVRRLDEVMARAQHAESRYHLAKASEAWAAQQRTAAGEELVMATDHLERAARDVGVALSAGGRKAADDARTLATRLMQGGTAAATEFDEKTAALAAQLQQLESRLGRAR